MRLMNDRPTPAEYAPYYGKYISLVPDGAIVDILERQFARTLPFYQTLTADQAALRYAPGKWSIKQVIAHVTDAERVFAYRAFAFSRSESKPLPGFEQNDYVNAVDFDAKPWAAIVEEFAVVRAASVALFKGMTPEMLLRKGNASGHDVSVRACGFMVAGHEEHHVRAIRQQYLGQSQ
jgi:hypothetical protein